MRANEKKVDIRDHGKKYQPFNQLLNVSFLASEPLATYGEAEVLEENPCNVWDESKNIQTFWKTFGHSV